MKKQIILILDSDTVARSRIKELLDPSGTFRLIEAANSTDALAILTEQEISCIIMENILSDTNVTSFLKIIREKGIMTPVIVLTDSGNADTVAGAFKAGASDYYSKVLLESSDAAGILSGAIERAVFLRQKEIEKARSNLALTLSESRYKSLVENAPILIMRFFPEDFEINFANDALCNYLDTERYDLLGESIIHILNPDPETAFTDMTTTLSAENPVGTFESITTQHKITRWQFWTVQAIFDEAKTIHEYQCLGEDITDLKLLNIRLEDSLDQIQQLKSKQDGDYFLTNLILEPLNQNLVQSEAVSIDYFIKWKKEVHFKKWKKQVGGDICYAHMLYLEGKPYIVFTNADAMGKSIQGAGGALVFGSAFKSIVNQTRFSEERQQRYPEVWLRDTYAELQSTFETFGGSMLISAIIGLIDEETGLLYFINAEHPFPVLYQEKNASFIEGENALWKIGTRLGKKVVQIQMYKLAPGDIILLGSDGKDDIRLKETNGTINDNEKLFLSIVEEGAGDLKRLYDLIIKRGELIDDLSLMRIEFTGPVTIPEAGKNNTEDHYLKKSKQAPDNATAIREIQQGLNLFPHSHPLTSHLIKLLRSEKDFSTALSHALPLIEKYPEDTELIYKASTCAVQNDNDELASRLAERAYLRDPFNLRYVTHYVKILFKEKKTIAAHGLINSLLEHDSENYKVHQLKQLFGLDNTLYQWDSRYDLGIEIINREHQKLFSTMNKIIDLTSKESNQEQLVLVIDELIDYSEYHFQSEERILTRHQYPEIKEHQGEHEMFREIVILFKKQFLSGKALLQIDIFNYLANWFAHHVQVTDRKYASFFKDNGIVIDE